VSVKAAPPAAVVDGESELTLGSGFGAAVIEKPTAVDVPPPGVGLNTVTCAVPAAAMSAPAMVAVNCPLFTNVVERSVPFQRTTAPDTKKNPFTVRVKPAPPAVAEDGDRALSPGRGLSAAETVSENVVVALEIPDPLAVTVTVWLLTMLAPDEALSRIVPLLP